MICTTFVPVMSVRSYDAFFTLCELALYENFRVYAQRVQLMYNSAFEDET